MIALNWFPNCLRARIKTVINSLAMFRKTHSLCLGNILEKFLVIVVSGSVTTVLAYVFKETYIQANFGFSNSDISIYAKSCFFPIVYLNQICFLESNHGCGDSFYNSEWPEMQINRIIRKIVPILRLIEIWLYAHFVGISLFEIKDKKLSLINL